MTNVGKKLVFSTEGRCSYYSSKKTQRQAGNNAKKVWGKSCCPIVYLKTGEKRFTAFCLTRGGAWGEQLPALSGSGPKAVRVELQALSGESWEEIVEKAAKIACKSRI